MFRFLFLLAAFLAISYGAVLPPDSKIPDPEGRIVGGEDCKIEEAPYQVALLFDAFKNGSFMLQCGGSIISKTSVVTAGHCAFNKNASLWKIRAGSANRNMGGQVIPVKKIIQHEKYDTRDYNDIGLFLLAEELIFGTTVSPIALPAQGAEVPDGSPAFVTGWGDTTGNFTYPEVLQKITVPIVNQEKCVTDFSQRNISVTNGMICAGLEEQGGMDACKGDSGGPLVVNKTLIGITSFGFDCALPHFPGVYTRVPMYVYWIKYHMKINN